MKKLLAVILAAISMFSLFSGCSRGGGQANLGEIDHDKQVELTIWVPLEPWASQATYDKNEPYQIIAEELNLKLTFRHPSIDLTSAREQFNTMMTDKTLPDIIMCGNWYNGGVAEGVRQGLFVDLSDYVEEYAPDYYRRVNANEAVKKEIVNDEKYYAIYGFSETEELCYSGPIWNKKALERVGEEVPVTIADWERVLGKFKNQLGMRAPFGIHELGLQYSEQAIVSAYGAASGFMLDTETDKVVYGPELDGYIDYVNLIRKWKDLGYIAADFDTRDWATNVSDFQNMQQGVMFDNPANAAALLGEYNVDWVEGSYPVLNEGDELNLRLKLWMTQAFNGSNNSCAVITRDCQNVARALEFLNYGFTDEGILLFNYGTEGKTYEIDEQGNPKFINDYFFDPSINGGVDLYNALYTFKNHNGVFVRQEQTANPSLQKYDFCIPIEERWTREVDSTASLPPLSYTRDEEQIITLYFIDINDYVVSQQVAFIFGQENDIGSGAVASYGNDMQKTLKAMGIDEILEVVQAAYERYKQNG